MSTWELKRLSPNASTLETVNGNTSHEFDIPNNETGDEYTYGIYYTDAEGCTASTSVTIPACDCGCKCSNLSYPNGSTIYLSSNNGATGETTYAITNCHPADKTALSIKSKPDWINATILDGKITVTATSENSGTIIRTGDIILSVCGNECNDKKISIQQGINKISINANITFIGKMIEGTASNPIFNSLRLYFSVVYNGTTTIYRELYGPPNTCPCPNDCNPEYKTFAYNQVINPTNLNISNNDTDWSHYDVEILIDSAIAREYEVNQYCQYSFVNLSDPMHIWQQVGIQRRWKTTLDRIMNKTMTIFIEFKGHN